MSWSFIHPGSLSQITGGSIYDHQILTYLQKSIDINIYEIPGNYPRIGDLAKRHFDMIEGQLNQNVIIDGLAGLLVAKQDDAFWEKRNIIILFHNPIQFGDDFEPEIQEFLTKRELNSLNRATGVICTSQFSKQYIKEHTSQNNILVAPPGKPARVPSLNIEKPLNRPPKILSVGNVTRNKNVERVLMALKEVQQPVEYSIVGEIKDRQYYQEMSRRIEKYLQRHRIIFEGKKNDTASYYQKADLFVHVPHHESYGMVLVEAMSFGLPIIASNTDGIPYTLRDAGHLIDDQDELADSIKLMLNSHELRKTNSYKAIQRYEELPTWKDTAVNIQKFLLESQ